MTFIVRLFAVLLTAGFCFSGLTLHAQETTDERTGISLETDWETAESESAPEDEETWFSRLPVHYRAFARESLFSNVTGGDQKRVFSASSTRLRGEAVWNSEHVKAEVSANLDYVIGNRMDSPEAWLILRSRVRNRAMSLETVNDHPDFIVKADIHRLNIAYRTESLTLSAGRQVISWGEGRFYNPMNLVSPVSIFLMDMEDIPGQDLINIHYYFNSYDSVQFVAVPYTRNDSRHTSRLKSADTNALARFKGTFGNADLVFVGGRHFHSSVWGLESTVTAWDAAFRFAYLGRQEDLEKVSDSISRKAAHQIILGVSYAFWKGKIRTNAEVFANSAYHSGDGDIAELHQREALTAAGIEKPVMDDDAFFRTSGRIFTRNPYLIQLSAGGQVTDTVNLDVFLIGDPVGKSLIYGPSVSWSFSNEGILSAGARLYGFGRDSENAEFKGGNPMVFGLARVYF